MTLPLAKSKQVIGAHF